MMKTRVRSMNFSNYVKTFCGKLRLIAAAFVMISMLSGQVFAVTDLERGDKAPVFELADVNGNWVDSSQLLGRTVVVIFGELYHDKTLWACERLAEILKDDRLSGENIDAYVVVAQVASDVELKKNAQVIAAPIRPLHDPARQAFGAYRVAVMPSVIVIDSKGLVVYAQAGVSSRFEDILLDSLLVAEDKLSVEAFDKSLDPIAPKPISEKQVRAQRVGRLGDQLVARGMEDLAMEKYHEAIVLAPNQPSPHLGLAHLLIKRQRLAEAEYQYRAVLAVEPMHIDGQLGLAFVQTLRGGEELIVADQTVRDLIKQRPTNARAYYLLGLIQEKKGDIESACESFKKAAELLMESSSREVSR